MKFSQHFRMKKTTLFLYSIFGIIVTLLLLILALIATSYVFIAAKSNTDHIELPEGKVLYDLNQFTFRDESLYRYHSDYIVLDEDEEFEIISAFSEEGNEDEVRVLTATQHINNNEVSVECEGKCECYEEELEEGRRVSGSLIYSSRYTGVVLVSVLGYATAKFIDERIDDCYESAQRGLGNDERTLLSCSMDSSNCKTDEAIEEKKVEKRQTIVYQCVGHCVEKPESYSDEKFKQIGGEKGLESAKAAYAKRVKELDCESKSPGKQRMHLIEGDITAAAGKLSNEAIAVLKYKESFLIPFCKAKLTTFVYSYPGSFHADVTRFVRPCTADVTPEQGSPTFNIQCKESE